MKRLDESKYFLGAKFAKWEIVGPCEMIETNHGRRKAFPCRCECGTKRVVSIKDLVRVKSCGCIPTGRKFDSPDLEVDTRYGNLTVIGPREMIEVEDNRTRSHYLCRCDCGSERMVSERHLTGGQVVSCGCMKVERARKNFTTHGESSHRLNNIWNGMNQRCRNPSNPNFQSYGGRGISVCDRWGDFAIFFEWATSNGYRDDLTLDRIDVNGNYCPENCRFATIREQNLNQRRTTWYTCFNETKRLSEWAEDPRCKVNYYCLYGRLKLGWDIENSLTQDYLYN